MGIKKKIKIITALICLFGLFVIYCSNYYGKETISKVFDFQRTLDEEECKPGYVISQPNCRILDPDPWDETIEKYLEEPKPVVCSRPPLLTYVEQLEDSSNVLKINPIAIHKYKIRQSHEIKCCYNIITRITQGMQDYNKSADNLYKLSECHYFEEQAVLSNDTEFIIVDCQSRKKGRPRGKSVYTDAHPIVPILPEVNSKLKKALKNSKKLNLLILGLDSVSKLNLRRRMPRTLKYLQEKNWIELNGYNKVGENTLPNLMAILNGESMRSLEKKCGLNPIRVMDDCPFLWKELSKKGYVTLYAEDTPTISTFNLIREGFVEKPTDYYMRPFMVAGHDLLSMKIANGLPVCIGPVLVVDHILNYAKRFVRTFRNYNYFSLLWLNSLSHNNVNLPRALDVSVHKFLQELAKIGTYDSSLILVLSDHGSRFGNMREALLGFLEERMPFMFIWTPKWFREAYPNKYNHLIINRNRLTSPYDIYVTIKKLLNENEGNEPLSSACPKCNGLLEVQPLDRSCADASIDINWCLCSEFRKIPLKDKIVQDIAAYLFEYLVNKTGELIAREKVNKTLCAEWAFIKVFRTEQIILSATPQQYSLKNIFNLEIDRIENEKLSSDVKIFVVILELSPGQTKFESTVRVRLNANAEATEFALLEPPKRLDSFYITSQCVQNHLLKQYCYCVKKQGKV